ncbi:MAG: molybdate ABC transporter substrate-binding protein [Gammaproteobacteria bacterium]|nr:molybdate ABC transporter substrate-binding protein [Gammaproteobacteria bacterium]
MVNLRRLLLPGLLLLLIPFSPLLADNLTVAVASNFYPTLNLIKARFEQQQPHTLTLIRGSTGKLYAQIIHGAPYDVFLAADVKRPLKLEQAGMTVAHTRLTYAIGALALWRPQSTATQIEQLFNSGTFNHFAIANPKTAPYGTAAMQWLEQADVLNTIRPKLVYGENIAQTFQFIESGSAELGLVALSQVINHSAYWPIDSNKHQPLEQQMVILKTTQRKTLAQQFRQFLQSQSIHQLIQQQGYTTP